MNTHNLQLFKCLRFCQRPAYIPEFLSQVYDPLSAQVYLLVAEVSTLCADYLDWERDRLNVPGPATASSFAQKAQSLDFRAQNIISGIPPRFTYSRVFKNDCPQLPFWIARLVTDPRAPPFVHTYSGFGPCFLWNTIRYARIRLHQMLLTLSDMILDAGLRSNSIETILKLEGEISSTIYALLLATDQRDLGRESQGQEIPGFRSFLLVRCLLCVKLALRFLDKRGVYVDERLAWVEDVWECLQQNLSIFIPPQIDPLY